MPLLLAAAYFVAGRTGLLLAFANPSASPVWPASGVALAAVLVWRRAAWRGVFVGAFLVNVTTTGSVATSLGIAAGNTLEAVVGAYLARRFCGAPDAFNKVRHVFLFVLLACVLSASIAATVGVTSLYLGGLAERPQYAYVWLTWWLGDTAGAVIVAPVLLLWLSNPSLNWSRKRLVEMVALILCLAMIGWVVFFATVYPINFVCLALCVWAALRFGQREAATVTCMLSAIAVCGTLQGDGVFSQYSPNEALWLLQAFMASCALIALGLGAAVSERALAEEQLRQFNRELGQRVGERTIDLQTALERATRSETRLAEAQHVAHVGSWEWTVAENSASWSDELYRIFGVDPNFIAPSYDGFLELVHPEDRDRLTACIRRALEDHQPFECEHRVVRPTGEVRALRSRGRVIVDPAGCIVRVAGTGHDVTEHNQLEEHLRQSQKLEAVGRLAGGIAHDFNNLLTPLTGYAEMVLEQIGDDKPISSDLHEIRKAAESATVLIRQLLTFSRKQVVRTIAIDLNKVISNIEQLLRRTLGEDVRVLVHRASNLHCIQADPSQLQQVLVNLAVNARDAMPKGGALRIETANVDPTTEHVLRHQIHPGPYVSLSVSDTGHGMDPETQRHAFEPFFTTKAHRHGTGLGLAMVYSIVEQLGGKIRLTSEVHRGTTFTLFFPATAAPEDERIDIVPRSNAVFVGSESVLVVEDDGAVRLFTTRVLERHGYRVHAASTPSEALTILHQCHASFDLLVTDMVMPEMNGRELVARVCAAHPRIRALYMSGYSERATSSSDASGVGEVLEKPFKSSELLRRVREVLDEPAHDADPFRHRTPQR